MYGIAKPSGKSNKAMEQHYQAEDDLRALCQVTEMKKDKARHKRALALARKMMKGLKDLDNG